MCCITEHLYVTEAQKAYVVPRPRDILPNSLPRLSPGSGWARLPEFNSKHSRGGFRPRVKQLSVDCDICLPRTKSLAPPAHLLMPKPRGAAPRVFRQHQSSGSRPGLARSGERYQPPGSGLSVGVGVLLVFSSLAEMYSLTITMPADQRQSKVLSCCRLCCD